MNRSGTALFLAVLLVPALALFVLTSNTVQSADVIFPDPAKVAQSFPAPASFSLFLPMLQAPSCTGGICGRVTFNGAPAADIRLSLEFFDGSKWSTADITTTNASGIFHFTSAATLTPGQGYYVSYSNSAYPTLFLSAWTTRVVGLYVAGSTVAIGDFDIADVPLVSPANGANVSLPALFTWTQRAAVSSDSYQFYLIDIGDKDPWWHTDPALGHVNSYQLTTLPAGFAAGDRYAWYVGIVAPDGAMGVSRFWQSVCFQPGCPPPSPAPARPQIPPMKAPGVIQ